MTIRTRKEKDWDTVLLYKTGIHIAEMAERVYEAMIERYDPTSVERVQSMFHALPIQERQEMNVTGNDLLNWANKSLVRGLLRCFRKSKKQSQGNVVNEKERIREWLKMQSTIRKQLLQVFLKRMASLYPAKQLVINLVVQELLCGNIWRTELRSHEWETVTARSSIR